MKQSITELVAEAGLLASQGKSSCMTCEKNFCCVGQCNIEISSLEWNTKLKALITPEQESRALQQVKKYNDPEAKEPSFDCPFNDPDTGKCEIYDDRFYVCAQYNVSNPKEHCDSKTRNGLSVINPTAVFRVLGSSMKYGAVTNNLAKLAKGDAVNMIDAWRKYLEEKGIL